MKTISEIDQIRVINIFKKAIENGFNLDMQTTIDENRVDAEAFLVENTNAIEEECEVKSLGSHGQRVDYCDSNGWSYWSQGEIVNFGAHWHKSPETKVFHETIIDSNAQVIKLYYLVGKTDCGSVSL